jgi:hypothetical protein
MYIACPVFYAFCLTAVVPAVNNTELNYSSLKIFIAKLAFDPRPVRVGFEVDRVAVG